jgi:hypothetical protein
MTLVSIYDNRYCSSRPRRDAVATRREAFLPPSSRVRNQATAFSLSLSAIFFHGATQSVIRRAQFLRNISTHAARNNRPNSFKTNNRRGNISTQNADSAKCDFEPKSSPDSALAGIYACQQSTRRICEHSIHPRTLSRTICYMIKFTPLACGVYRRHCVRRNHGSRALLRNDEWRGDA